FDWNLVEKHADIARFCRGLIAFRRRQPTVRRASFLVGEPAAPGLLPDVTWFNAEGGPVEWSGDEHSLVCLFGAWPTSGPSSLAARHMLILLNDGAGPQPFVLPPLAQGIDWRLFVNTAAESPDDIYPDADGPPPAGKKLTLVDHSLVCFVAA
ncbi:MAG: glycogen debranching enzyme, partial [Candidatus Saccharimonadales bacterium]